MMVPRPFEGRTAPLASAAGSGGTRSSARGSRTCTRNVCRELWS